MYAYLNGELKSTSPSKVILDVQGVGYLIFIPTHTFGKLPELGQKVCLYTTFVVRELSHSLYGFLSEKERELFEVLMDISGVGPKLALSLISHLSFSQLHSAVSTSNIPVLCKVPGVGKKTAERLLIELRDKITTFSSNDSHEEVLNHPQAPRNRLIQDAMLALINLGYNQNVAQKALKTCLKDFPEEIDLAELITAALKAV